MFVYGVEHANPCKFAISAEMATHAVIVTVESPDADTLATFAMGAASGFTGTPALAARHLSSVPSHGDVGAHAYVLVTMGV